MRVVVLGAGFGGLELTTRLSEELGDDVDVVLIDQADGFVFGFSKLDVMFGRTIGDAVTTRTATSSSPACGSCRSTVRAIDPDARRVETDAGASKPTCSSSRSEPTSIPAATPGLVEGGHEFYTVAGRVRAARRAGGLRRRTRGRRGDVDAVQVPARAERDRAARCTTSSRERGLRERSRGRHWSCRCGVPIPPSPAASAALLAAFEERGIAWHPERQVRALDPARKVVVLGDGTRCPTTSSSAYPCTACRRSSNT